MMKWFSSPGITSADKTKWEKEERWKGEARVNDVIVAEILKLI